MKLSARDLRRANRSTILRSLYFDGPTSRLELSQRTHLSTATVTNVVAELLAEGGLIETGSEESQGGRPRTILAIHAAHGYIVGVDVGEQHLGIEVFDLTLHKIAAISQPILAELQQPERVVEQIANGIQQMLEREHLDPERVLGVGIGVPGMVEDASEIVVHAPSIGWNAVPFMSWLTPRLPYPLFLDNGANAMTQAELLVGAGRGYQQIAVVLVGTGVGAGLVVNGKLYRGATNSAGEWGHTKIALDGRLCRCGGQGCLEAYIGSQHLLSRLRDLDPHHIALQCADEEQAIAELVKAGQQRTDASWQILTETAQYLGLGIANLINLFNPQRIVLGGWVGLLIGPTILPEIRQATQHYALTPPFQAANIDLCHLGQDAVAMGAATLVLEQFLATGGVIHSPIHRETIFV